MIQEFYLVCRDDIPCKIFLQKKEAVKWGRACKDDGTMRLYSQPITRTGSLKYLFDLTPYA